ncbi:hypothetical protein FA95DRAFT_1560806 [Auriscalpium vulgare]|uniref:Uncharacterized protein n=1 Tax=Auriscalpium vulgare TaxID=40419 RepID=A0ACB8RPV5_9AGAM|nr:hypothetical protein FA95DRAFT_1560806 [Auriscalpium vulgare]
MSPIPVVEVVTFRVNDKFKSDPALFKACRDHAERHRGKGLNEQYWGQMFDKPFTLLWFLLWDSREAHSVLEAEPTYPSFVAQIQELSDGPINVMHVHVVDNHPPTAIFDAPMTNVSIYLTSDEVREDTERKVTAFCEGMRAIIRPEGLYGCAWGPSLESRNRGFYIAGWRSLEDHVKLELGEIYAELAESMIGELQDLQMMRVHLERHT